MDMVNRPYVDFRRYFEDDENIVDEASILRLVLATIFSVMIMDVIPPGTLKLRGGGGDPESGLMTHGKPLPSV